jgi:alginate O-acetyltransferase complex protein AlgI
MLFNSYTFLIFLVVVLVVSRWIANWVWRKSFLLIASYVFYAAWNPPFVILLWISTLIDWHASKRIHRAISARAKNLFLLVSLAANLGMLFYFKYGGFVIENLNYLAERLGINHQFGNPSIILPVGISFYTFQTLSYTIDIYKGKMKPWHSFLDYALYVTFFPQLVAGPIVRAAEFLPQCTEKRQGTREQIGWGLSLLVIGLFAKVVVADGLTAPVVENVYAARGQAGFLSAWTGTLAFAVQIFCDFYGYSTCAVGAALCMGFSLPDNFRWPYAAIGFSDFWSRWHISLSSWLRDYLYIPLGGNRKGNFRTYVNLSVTMLLGGLWHGASWMFVIWGALHGGYLIAERLIAQTRVGKFSIWGSPIGRFLLSGFTFSLVCFTWVFFRARDIRQAFSLCSDMLDLRQAVSVARGLVIVGLSVSSLCPVWLGFSHYGITFLCTLSLLSVHWILRESDTESFFKRVPWIYRSFLLSVMLYLVAISIAGEDRAFIYFQF